MRIQAHAHRESERCGSALRDRCNLCSDANAASVSAAAAAAAIKQEPASVKIEDTAEAGQGEQEAREQLAKRDAELAMERAACLKLQRCSVPPCACNPLPKQFQCEHHSSRNHRVSSSLLTARVGLSLCLPRLGCG